MLIDGHSYVTCRVENWIFQMHASEVSGLARSEADVRKLLRVVYCCEILKSLRAKEESRSRNADR